MECNQFIRPFILVARRCRIHSRGVASTSTTTMEPKPKPIYLDVQATSPMVMVGHYFSLVSPSHASLVSHCT